ncbi:PD40 domain-containing protein, partial [bacterium]|nr:PD40 domain-containing protein [bacterium]
WNIYIRKIDGNDDGTPDNSGEERNIYTSGSGTTTNALTPSWVPSGESIIFVRCVDGHYGGIHLVNISTGALTHVWGGNESYYHRNRWPSVSPDGNKVVFRKYNSNTLAWALYTMNIDGTGITLLIDGNPTVYDRPRWSPDGSRIIFDSDLDGNYDLWAINSDGTDLHKLTLYGGLDCAGEIFPDGSKICFISSRGAEAKDNVWIMDNPGEMYKPIAYIYSPVKDTIISTADVDILGIAGDNISADGSTMLADMEYFVLDYEDTANPGVWTPINSSNINVYGNVLGTWNTGGLYGKYNVRVSAFIGGEVKNTYHLSYDVQTGFITDFTVDNASISPNSDGNKDSAVFSYTIASDSTITLLIKKKSDDSLVKTLLFEESKTTGTHICEWDGSDLDLETVVDGYYYAEISAVQSGSESNKKIEIKVDRKLPYALITTPGEGESVGSTFEIRGSATDDSFDHFTLRYSVDSGSTWMDIPTGAEQVQEGLLSSVTLPGGITSGTDVIIALRVYDEANPFSEDILNVVTDFDAPAQPDPPTTSVDQNSIIVNWPASPEPDVIRYVIYRDDTEVWQSTDLSFTEVMNSDGTYEYKISAVDSACNESLLSTGISQIIDVDHSPPESTLTFGDPFQHFLGYTKISQNTQINITSTDIDIAGLADIYYKWDFESYHTANSGDVIAIPEGMSGNHSLYYYGIDNYGNKENEKRRMFDIDTTPPMTFLVPTGKYTVSGNVYTVGANYDTFNFTSHYYDTSIIHYRITTYSSTEPWNTYSGSPFQIADTTLEHTVEFYAIDDMDNTEETEVVTIVFDSTPPSTTPLIESLSQTDDGVVTVALKDRSGEENPSFLIHRKISGGIYSEIGETDSAIFNDTEDKTDGSTYFYKAQVADQYGNVLDTFSDEVSILVDMISPEVTSITLNPSGIIDNEIVSVTVDISEELREDPAFKAKIPSLNDWEKEIPLSFVSETSGTYTWTGTFLLDAGDGTGEFGFSGVDLAGNTGTNIGTPVTFEANIHAPYITDIGVIDSINGLPWDRKDLNEDIFPVSVEFSEELDSETLEFYYIYNASRYDITLSVDPGNPFHYTGDIALMGFTGEGPAEFFFSGDDLYGKTGTNIGEYNTSPDR